MKYRMIWPAAMLTLLAACGTPEAPLSVNDSWAREALPGRNTTAAYLQLSNNGADEIVIDRITSPQFARIEVHETTMIEGRMQMRRVETLSIAPGESVSLAPGGLHLMLMAPRGTITELTSVELSLFTQDQPLAQLTLPVARTNPHDN